LSDGRKKSVRKEILEFEEKRIFKVENKEKTGKKMVEMPI